MMRKGMVIGIAVAAVVVLSIITLIILMPKDTKKAGNSSGATSSTQGTDKNETSDASSTSGTRTNSDSCPPVAANVVVFCGGSFNSITVSAGDEVIFLNNSNETVEPSSDPHPTHTKNPQLNIGELTSGERKSVTLTKVGTWGFHNHLDPSQKGTVVVK